MIPASLQYPANPLHIPPRWVQLSEELFGELSTALKAPDPPDAAVLLAEFEKWQQIAPAPGPNIVDKATVASWLDAYAAAVEQRETAKDAYTSATARLLRGRGITAAVPFVVAWQNNSSAQVLRLELVSVSGGAGGFWLHPSFAHRRSDMQAETGQFLAAITDAWASACSQCPQLVAVDVFWRLTTDDGGALPALQLDGPSASAAAFRAFWHITRALQIDPDVYVVADATSADGRIEAVGDLRKKINCIQAAQSSRYACPPTLVAAQRLSDDDIAAFRAASEWAELIQVSRLEELVALRSCAANAVIAHMEHLRKELDETPWTRNSKPVRLSDVNLPTEVWKDEYPIQPAAEDAKSHLEQQRPKVRVPWMTEFQGPQRQPIVIVGGTSFARTSLLRWPAREIVLESLAVLNARTKGWEEVRWPIIADLAAWLSKGEDTHDTLRDAAFNFARLSKTHPRLQREALLQVLETRLINQTERTYLFLDALDEVPAAQLRLLRKRLSVLNSFASRLVISTREAARTTHLPVVALPRLTILEAVALSTVDPRMPAEQQQPYDEALERIDACRHEQRTKLDLSGLGLTRLPPEVFEIEGLTMLDLSINQLTTLPPEIGQLTALTELRLMRNDLTTLPSEIFRLAALSKLYLTGNPLAALAPGIGQLTALTELYLINNQLTTLPPEIGHLTALTVLNLEHNHLTTLPPEILQIKTLTELRLSHNQFTTLPPEIVRLKALTTLALCDNQLTTLPLDIRQLEALAELYLSDNQFTSLPLAIVQLKSLTRLILSNNPLKTLPPEIGQLRALTALYIEHNQLTALPREISQLTRLTGFYLSNNQLTTLPAEIVRLRELTELDLSNNRLATVPSEICQLKALTTLALSSNELTTVPPEISHLKALSEFHLSDNKLTALPPEIGKLTRLERLFVESNELRELPESMQSLARLKDLTLHGSYALKLPAEVLGLDYVELQDESSPAKAQEILQYYFGQRTAAGDSSEKLGLSPVTPSYLPERNPHFRGRKADLAHLNDELNRSATIGITQQVALFASGGVGKSSLALEFGWECLASAPTRFPGGVFWCDCRGRDVASMADGLAAFARALGIDAGEGNDPFPAARKVRDRLASGPPCLLILDNVLDSEQWKDEEWSGLLPTGSCRRLLTTRAESLGDHRIPMVRLACLSMLDARGLLHAYREDVPLEERDDTINEIIHWFGGLAVGLTVVGIYLRIHSNITWNAYWKSLREKKLDTVRGTEEHASPADYAIRVDAVIDDLFRSQSQAEQRALLYTSTLPGEDVSDRWLIELLADDVAAKRITGNTPPGYSSFPQAVVAGLISRGILLRLIDSPARKTVFLHQVVRERFRELSQRDRSLSRDLAAHVRQFISRIYHRSCQWTRAIAESANFSEAQKLLASMQEADCDPNVFTFTTLVSKAETYAEARAVVVQMEEAGEKPNSVTYAKLMLKAGSYAEAKAVITEMEAAGEKPSSANFNALMWKVDTYAEGMDLLPQLMTAGVKPELFILKKLLWRACTYDQAKAIVKQMQAVDEKPSLEILNALLAKAKIREEIDEVVAQMEALGVKPNFATFNKLVAKATTYDEAKAVVTQMEAAGEVPTFITYNRLMSHVRNDAEVTAVVAQMRAAGVEPNARNFKKLLSKTRTADEVATIVDLIQKVSARPAEVTVTTLLATAESYDEAKGVLAQMKPAGVSPDVITFNTLLSKTANYAVAKAVFDEMQKVRVTPDLVTFTALLSKTASYNEAKGVLDQMQKPSTTSGLVTFIPLLQKAQTHEVAKAILHQMQKAGVKPDVVTFNTLLQKMGSFDQARAVFDQMRTAGVKPNIVTFNTLLQKAGSFDQTDDVFDQMQKVGIKANVVTISTVLQKARGFDEAKAVFTLIQKTGAIPNVANFNLLLLKVGDHDDAKAVLDQMHKAGVTPNAVTFNTLLQKAGSYGEAKAVLNQMRNAGVVPNLGTFNLLLQKAKSSDETKAVLDQMQQVRTTSDVDIFTTLLQKAGSYGEAKAVFEQMQKAGATPNVGSFTALLSKAASYGEAKAVFEQMQDAGEMPNVSSFTALMAKAGNYDEAKVVFDQMQNAGATPNVVTFTVLLSKAGSFNEAKAVLDQMLKAGAKPDVFAFTTLFSKREGLPPVREVLRWYYELPFHPAAPLNALIGSLAKLNRAEEAMTIALQHPFLSAGHTIMRDFPDCALALFESAKATESRHPTADLALGILAMETHRPADARLHLRQALQRATNPNQVMTIQAKLKLLG